MAAVGVKRGAAGPARPGTMGIVMIRAAAVLLALARGCGCNSLIFLDEAPGGGVVELTRASLYPADEASPPPAAAPGWATGELPDLFLLHN